MKQSGLSLSKLLLAVGIFAMAQHASAATMANSDNTLNFVADPTTHVVVTDGASFEDYQILLAPNQNVLEITLDAILGSQTSKSGYRLWLDSDSRPGWFAKGAEVYAREPIKVGDSLSWIVNPLNQYVLRINPVGGVGVSATSSVSAVPVPGAIWLFGSALLGFLGFSNRRKI